MSPTHTQMLQSLIKLSGHFLLDQLKKQKTMLPDRDLDHAISNVNLSLTDGVPDMPH